MLKHLTLRQIRFGPSIVASTTAKTAPHLTSTCLSYSTNSSSNPLPGQARVVIAGAGVVANSVAYHLISNGWTDVLVLDQNKIGSGTSSHGSGILGLFKPIEMRRIITYSISLYKQLEQLGYNIRFNECGGLCIAQTTDRMIALQRRLAYNQPTGLQCQVVPQDRLKSYHPYLNTEDLVGGVWIPEDGVADPTAICDALADLARTGGAQYRENCKVERVITQGNQVKSVETSLGNINCEYFVNCSGMWARELGLASSPPVAIPAYPAELYSAVTINLKLDTEMGGQMLPIVRDYDAHQYVRQIGGNLMLGWFEKEARPVFSTDNIRRNIEIDAGSAEYKHFAPLWQSAVKRVPILKTIPAPKITISLDTFTPDGRWVLGESADVKNYFVAVGMNGYSLQGAGGIGRAIAEWIIAGNPTQELHPFGVQRFHDLHNNRKYLEQRTKEIVGRHYSILYPHQCEYKYARQLRCSPLYTVHETRGAVWGIKMAYERPLYFDPNHKRGDPPPEMPSGSFYRPLFIDFMYQEYLACKESVGIIDMSSFSKMEIKTTKDENSVVNFLQRICSNDVNLPVGGMVQTGMQNERGGYENDCMLVRQSNHKFFMVSPSNQQTRIYQWMARHLPSDSSVRMSDVTSKFSVINVVGPKAGQLINELSNTDINMAPFTYRKMNIGYASDVIVMSFTNTGDAGYSLYVPSEYALHVYDQLMTVGHDYGVRDVGTLTQRFMRIEKFIPFWGEELGQFVTPYEAGYGAQVKLNKDGNFIGKNALKMQKEEGVTKRLVMFHLTNIDAEKDIWPWGGEPIFRDGQYVGNVTSSGFGFTVNKLICLGFIRDRSDTGDRVVTHDFILDKNALYEIDIAGTRFKMQPHLYPPVSSNDGINENKPKTKYKPTVVKIRS